MSASKTPTASQRITGAQLLAQCRSPAPKGEFTARVVNGASIRTAKLGAALAASGDNFSAHYDLERSVLRGLADLQLRKEADRAAERLNAALR